MSWLPSPPTDNLYKFMAISGVYLLLGLIAFFSWAGYMQFRIERESIRSLSYFSSVVAEREISARLMSINANRPLENKLSWIPAGTPMDDEKRLLEQALSANKDVISKNKDVLEDKIGEELSLLKALGFYWIAPIYVAAAVFFPYFGFSRWYKKVQIPNEEAHVLDCRIKQATIRKLEREIKKLS